PSSSLLSFFPPPPPPLTPTLSLHDALPISGAAAGFAVRADALLVAPGVVERVPQPEHRAAGAHALGAVHCLHRALDTFGNAGSEDRKSTRLNSSHVAISYAVFCLKKKIR